MSYIEKYSSSRPRRPVGFGRQLPVADRNRKSWVERSATGALRVDFSLDPDTAIRFAMPIAQWPCATRKAAIQKAINIVYASVYGEVRGKG